MNPAFSDLRLLLRYCYDPSLYAYVCLMADMAQRATPALGKREGSTLVPEAAKRIKSGVDETVRIWWPPTDSRKRSGYSGMYWPATVVRIMADTCEVEYDNGDKEVVEAENVFPVPTVDFGEETHPFLVCTSQNPLSS